jgi:hypothetical protein
VIEWPQHDWQETGVHRPHIEGAMFRYGTPVVDYVKCTRCGKIGYRRPGSAVVFTWDYGGPIASEMAMRAGRVA